jgi:DNA excision repair protein ERCC-2
VSRPSYLEYFPYEPYDHQREAMDAIADALGGGRDVLFEGATGTGKTLAALAPALAYARAADKTVVITTNVHQQTRQFIEEARAITRQTPIQAVVFRGKLEMCHIDVDYAECQALREATRDAVDLQEEREELAERADALEGEPGRGAVMDELTAVESELEEMDDRTCDYYRANLSRDTDPFYEWLFDDVRTPEEIYEHAGQAGFCGYELLKEGMEGIDLAICNYHHLLDPMIREQFFRWLGREPEEVVAVFDESHNVESAARDHAARTLTETTLDGALAELEEADDPRAGPAQNAVGAFRAALRATYDEALAFGERQAVGDDWEDLSITNERGRDDLTLAFLDAYTGQGIHGDLDSAVELGEALDEGYQEAYKRGETRTRKDCRLLTAARFIDDWLRDSDGEGQYPVVSVRSDGDGDVYGRAELYTCIPQRVTAPLFEELHASVLMSATLRPFDVLSSVLGLDGDPVELAYGPQFPAERRRTYAVDLPALFASRRGDPEIQEAVAGALADAVRFTPGNTLAFFPSYGEAERYHDLLDLEGPTYLDRPGESAERLKRSFVDDEDATLFTSLWGTLAEGVSFDGDDARTVAVVGVPYPRLDDRAEAVQDAYETAFGNGEEVGWRYAVEVPTVRKTRQALGRVIRSPEDFGVRLLLDERYTRRARREMRKYSVLEAFPEEERENIIDIDPGKLRFAMLNFYSDMDAWPAEPPTP